MGINIKTGMGDRASATVERGARITSGLRPGSIWNWEWWKQVGRSGGHVLWDAWQETNKVVNDGLDYVLDVAFACGTQITTWYGLIFSDNHTPASTDSYATPGFTESTAYSEATRPEWQCGAVSGQSIDNSANKMSFTMNGNDAAIYGAALVGGGAAAHTPGNTAGGGILYNESKFSSPKTGIENGDVLKVQVTLTAQDV